MAVTASPGHPPLANSTGVVWIPSTTDQSTCDPATFVPPAPDERPRLEPADWRECAALHSQWVAANGTLRVVVPHPVSCHANAFVPLVQARDCVLAVKPLDAAKAPFTVGDADVATLLYTSLLQFSSGTLLAVGGVVNCEDASGERAALSWRIAKTAR
ncbi:hypothetical protein RJ55_03840 [Drechmeria coniospora]|nr:hypothetical protein RJ55_03840 [Drechmeria coniospora]